MFRSRWSDLGPWNIVQWKSHFSLLQGLFWYFGIFSGSVNFLQTPLIIPSSRDQNCDCLNNIKVCHSRWSDLGLWKSIVKVPFPDSGGVILIFSGFFSDSINFFQRLLVSSSSRDQILDVWLVSICVIPGWEIWALEYSRMNVPFSKIGGIILMFW